MSVDHARQLQTLPSGQPIVMGILNTTPDSFSDGGRWATVDRAVARAEQMLEHGAHIIDVGGESSRPGADPVDRDVELGRVLPVIERLAGRCVLSIDTQKPEVAEAALLAGASIVNDISASLEEVAGQNRAGWIAMHKKGDPKTMQLDTHYDDVVAEVSAAFDDYVRRGERAGVEALWVDPGFGFGKSIEHNLALLNAVEEFAVKAPLMVGISRKRTIGELHMWSDKKVITPSVSEDDRIEGSVMAAVWSWARGARIVRTHDVRITALAGQILHGHERVVNGQPEAEGQMGPRD